MEQTILVLGATGLLGWPVARRLQADGFNVRVLARDPQKAREMLAGSFEIVAGDVTDGSSLGKALEGCDGVHISIAGPADQLSAENVGALAPRLGLRRITYTSGSTVREENRWFPMIAQKFSAEQAIRASGVPYTIFCPTWPMEQLPRLAQGGRPLVVEDHPQPWHWFAADDFARMVSRAYQDEAAIGKKLFIHGPEAMTMREALERYCQAFYPEVDAVPVMPIEAARSMAASTGNDMLGLFAELMAYFGQVGELGDPGEANRLLGAPTTTLDRWIEQRKRTTGP